MNWSERIDPKGEPAMIFKRELSVHSGEFQCNGYILLKDVISDEFMAYLKDFHRRCLRGKIAEHSTWRIGGKKQQYVFDFGSDAAAAEFRAGIAALTGMQPEKIAISERHLKQYEAGAPDYPAPHKDRRASKIAVGLPVHLGPETSVCVMPGVNRTPNPGECALYMTEQENPDLAGIYQSEDVLLLNEELGDMIVFLGSSIFHERVRPRGTTVLYIKLNDENLDPLGEDIYSALKQQSPAALPATA